MDWKRCPGKSGSGRVKRTKIEKVVTVVLFVSMLAVQVVVSGSPSSRKQNPPQAGQSIVGKLEVLRRDPTGPDAEPENSTLLIRTLPSNVKLSQLRESVVADATVRVTERDVVPLPLVVLVKVTVSEYVPTLSTVAFMLNATSTNTAVVPGASEPVHGLQTGPVVADWTGRRDRLNQL